MGQYRDTDAAVALGVVPLATPNLDHFMQGGISPWVRERLTGEPPALFEFADGLPFEQLATFAPDLILATDHVDLAKDYETLTGIAPTLSTVSGYNRDPWQLTTTRVGKALGRSDAATAAVAKVENAVRTARETNPGFAGKTFTIGPVQPDGTIFTINSAKDSSALFMAQLGLKLSPKLTGLPPGNFPGRATVSRERLDVLDADVMILTFNTPQARTRLEADPLFKRIPAVRRGAYIPLDLPTAIAMGFPTALSIPYALDRSVPKIAAALAA
ncbi:ABC transporter substrate-binding protein [Actinopolymorpha pittospori]